MKKTFIQAKKWFERRGIWDKVCERIMERRGVNAEAMFRSEGGNMLNAGITWAATPEGNEYWNRLHEEFSEWYKSSVTNHDEDIKPLFEQRQKVKILNKLSSEIVDVNEEMNDLAGKTVTISHADFYGYEPYDGNDGVFYYIKEDSGINVWTSELFKKK